MFATIPDTKLSRLNKTRRILAVTSNN